MEISRPTLVRLLLVVPLLAAGIALAAPAPAAAATVCDTTSTGPVSLVIKDSVVVKAGTTCSLFGSVIRGGVTVEPGAHFHFENPGSEIRGSVTATAPASFILFAAVVRGAVIVTGGTSMGELVVRDLQVRGDLVLTGNTLIGFDPLFVWGNTVRGSVILRDNSSLSSPIRVQGNAVDFNLDCTNNIPSPIADTLNTVGGAATGQCAGLVAP